VVSKPSESRGKPETSVETPRVEKELLSTIENCRVNVGAIQRASGRVAPLVLHLGSPIPRIEPVQCKSLCMALIIFMGKKETLKYQISSLASKTH
jgi:hypothetical protein